jgi:hypothetical protein
VTSFLPCVICYSITPVVEEGVNFVVSCSIYLFSFFREAICDVLNMTVNPYSFKKHQVLLSFLTYFYMNCFEFSCTILAIYGTGWPATFHVPSLTGFGKYLHLLVLWSDLLRGDVGGTQVIKKVILFFAYFFHNNDLLLFLTLPDITGRILWGSSQTG